MTSYEVTDYRLIEVGHGIYYHRSARTRGVPGPPSLTISGVLHQRFMDYLYTPMPLDELDARQVQVLNRLRRDLMTQGAARRANYRVKRVFNALIATVEPARMLEWGCGYEPLFGWDVQFDYFATDIDPTVIAFQGKRGIICQTPEVIATIVKPSSVDIIPAVFVFHFRISDQDIDSMYTLLKPGGVVVANVYRRSAAAREHLEKTLSARGFTVSRHDDPQKLCTNHEYWIMSKGSMEHLVSALLRRLPRNDQ